MRHAWFPLVLVMAMPALAEEKLPIELPNVVVRGKTEVAPLKGGTKVSPHPEIHRINLPEADVPRASSGRVAQAELGATPSLSVASESLPVSCDQYQEVFAGIGNGLDLGFYAGRQWGENLGIISGEGQLTLGWTQLALKGLGQYQGTPLELLYRRNSQSTDLQEYAHLAAHHTFGDVETDLGASLGRVLGGTQNAMWEVASHLAYHPVLHEDHISDVRGTFGVQSTTGKTDGLAMVTLEDRWQFAPEWSLWGGLDLGTIRGIALADPGIRLSYRPEPEMEATVAALFKTEMPSYEELYLSRFRVQQNSLLLPQHRGGLEVSLSKYFAGDLYLLGVARYGKLNNGIVYTEQGGYWTPNNAQLQNAWGVEANLSQSLQDRTERLVFRLSGLQDTGSIEQRLGYSHDQSWGAWTFTVAPSLTWQQLGSFQTGLAASSAGLQALVDCRIGYRLNSDWQIFGSAEELPLLQQQPAPNYFTPATLALLGVKVRF